MGTPFKMKGSPMARNYGTPFKQDVKLPKGEQYNHLRTSNTASYRTTQPTNFPNNPDLTKRSYDIKVPKTTTANKVLNTGKKIFSKASKFLSGKTFGVASMLMATSSQADQPTHKQLNQNQFKKPDFKAVNKDLAKAMYKPLPK